MEAHTSRYFMKEAKGYVPFKLIYHHSSGKSIDYNIGCYLSCEDIGIISALFIVLWMCCLLYTSDAADE